MAKHIDQTLKEEILRAIKDGMKISEAVAKSVRIFSNTHRQIVLSAKLKDVV